MTRNTRMFSALVASLAAIAVLAPSASAAEYRCPGTFTVEHNDRIGGMQLPKGPYVVTVLDSATMGCTEASRLFSQFLEDWDGRLPRPWVATNSTRTFRAGRNSTVGFKVAPDTNPNPPTPPEPPSGRVCPGYFTVEHNDRIGSFQIPKGNYRITLLSLRVVGCRRAVRYLQKFLQDYDGVLPSPWHLDPGTGTFQRGHAHIGFRIKPYVSQEGAGEVSQGRHPSGGQKKCPATFMVEHNDSIGRLKLEKGNYNVWVKRLSCARSSKLFASFLDDPNGDLPSGWRLNVNTATFKKGKRLFRVKPVNP
jgi:hypothetical protein